MGEWMAQAYMESSNDIIGVIGVTNSYLLTN
jgi:hypothetical protein